MLKKRAVKMNSDLVKKVVAYLITALIGSGVTIALSDSVKLTCKPEVAVMK